MIDTNQKLVQQKRKKILDLQKQKSTIEESLLRRATFRGDITYNSENKITRSIDEQIGILEFQLQKSETLLASMKDTLNEIVFKTNRTTLENVLHGVVRDHKDLVIDLKAKKAILYDIQNYILEEE